MQFTHYDLGYTEGGTVVEVALSGSAANVRLLDSPNFQNYKAGRRHQLYGGGLVRQSPAYLKVPYGGYWHVTVDLQGLRGQTRSGIRVLPPSVLAPLPEYSSPPVDALSQLVHSVRAAEDGPAAESYAREWDVFISHATEDKNEVVRPLAKALSAAGLRVWYDEFELRLGDSLRRKVDAGLARSRFGVVVLSPSFFAKNWTQYELDGLVTREMTGQQVILPLWHKITKSEVIARSPSLADKIARTTTDFTIEQIAGEIAGVIRNAE